MRPPRRASDSCRKASIRLCSLRAACRRGSDAGRWRKRPCCGPSRTPCRRRPRRSESAHRNGADPLLDHLVCPRQQRGRDGEAEGLGGLEVDDQLQPCGLLDREIGRVGALEDPIDIGGDPPEQGGRVAAIRHQATLFHVLPPLVDRGQSMLRSQRDNQLSVAIQNRTPKDKKGIGPLTCHGGKGTIVIVVLYLNDNQLNTEARGRLSSLPYLIL